MSLKTDYKDFELAPEMGGKKRYKMINNDDGTVSFVDVSEYLEIGDAFKAEDINATNSAVNISGIRILPYGDYQPIGDGRIAKQIQIAIENNGLYLKTLAENGEQIALHMVSLIKIL